jgi:quinone-modifying oxidoreductase subunit QmoC
MTSEETGDSRPRGSPSDTPTANGKCRPVEPDMDFIRELLGAGGKSYRKCFQCGTCSGTCALSPDKSPFPRRQMAWAVWGMKDRLIRSPDIWLCYQCNDCTTRCPRDARPGDLLAAVRQQAVAHYSYPRLLGKWINQPQCIPLLLGIPAMLLYLAMIVRSPVEQILGFSASTGEKIIYPYSSMFPHWLINSFFGFFSLLVVAVMIVGVRRLWRDMKAADAEEGNVVSTNGMWGSIVAAFKDVFMHDKFVSCTKSYSRYYSHLAVSFGFLSLCLVTLWVITARYNPLIQGDFVYPFSFWNPWKMLANLGGAAIVAGCLWMMFERVRNNKQHGSGSYADWLLLVTLLLVVLSGFASEALHYVRLEPHRHLAYFAHLVSVFTLLIYLPYSKLAHVVYRTTAMVYAEHSGRNTVHGEEEGHVSEDNK